MVGLIIIERCRVETDIGASRNSFCLCKPAREEGGQDLLQCVWVTNQEVHVCIILEGEFAFLYFTAVLTPLRVIYP